MKLSSTTGALVLALLATVPATAQSEEAPEQVLPSNQVAAPVHAKVTFGDWDGTWYYVSRDYRIAMWIRTVDGKPQCKVQLMSLFAPEGFTTDWNGFAEYSTRETPGSFHLAVEEGGPDEIRGTWLWELQFTLSGRREEARVRMHRTGLGRTFSLVFEELERTVRRRDVERVYTAPRSWTFLKASNREVRWEELPF